MVWIVAIAAVAVIMAVVVAAVVRQRRLNDVLLKERAALDDARRSTEHLEGRVATLRQELSEQHRENAELNARLRNAGDTRSGGLWTLERIRQTRLAGTPTLRTSGPGIDMAGDLRAALGLELELLREEVGTYAEVTGVDLGNSVSPREALAVLRVVQELAAVLAKRADELAVAVQRDGDFAKLTVTAKGWSEPAPNRDLLERSVVALNGRLEQRIDAEVLTVEVLIPDRTI
jgi:signal transduction histidine kinase